MSLKIKLPRKTKQAADVTNPVINRVNVGEALKLRLKGCTYDEIARLQGVTKPAVIQRLKPFLSKDVDLPAFKDHRADLIAAKQAETLQALSADKLKNAGARDLAIVFGTLYDKERLERGQSTQNIAAFCASAVIQAHQENQAPATKPATIDAECTVTTQDD